MILTSSEAASAGREPKFSRRILTALGLRFKAWASWSMLRPR